MVQLSPLATRSFCLSPSGLELAMFPLPPEKAFRVWEFSFVSSWFNKILSSNLFTGDHLALVTPTLPPPGSHSFPFVICPPCNLNVFAFLTEFFGSVPVPRTELGRSRKIHTQNTVISGVRCVCGIPKHLQYLQIRNTVLEMVVSKYRFNSHHLRVG